MKKFFTGLIISSLFFAGCMDILKQPAPDQVSPGIGRVLVSVGGAGPERTIAPSGAAALVFAKYELSFEGPAPVNPVSITENLMAAAAVELPVGQWTIRAAGYTGTAGAYTRAAEGGVAITVNQGANPPANIALGPPASAGNGTFSYSITVPAGAAGSLVISPAEGGAGQTISLSAGVNANPARILASGQYLAQVRLEKGGASAGLAEVLHIYPGKTSTLPAKTYTDGDFTISVPAAVYEPVAVTRS